MKIIIIFVLALSIASAAEQLAIQPTPVRNINYDELRYVSEVILNPKYAEIISTKFKGLSIHLKNITVDKVNAKESDTIVTFNIEAVEKYGSRPLGKILAKLSTATDAYPWVTSVEYEVKK